MTPKSVKITDEDMLKSENYYLKKENEELKERIKKVIEYIEDRRKFNIGSDVYFIIDWNYVTNILKGGRDGRE